jgi:hypothetical protein
VATATPPLPGEVLPGRGLDAKLLSSLPDGRVGGYSLDSDVNVTNVNVDIGGSDIDINNSLLANSTRDGIQLDIGQFNRTHQDF